MERTVKPFKLILNGSLKRKKCGYLIPLFVLAVLSLSSVPGESAAPPPPCDPNSSRCG